MSERFLRGAAACWHLAAAHTRPMRNTFPWSSSIRSSSENAHFPPSISLSHLNHGWRRSCKPTTSSWASAHPRAITKCGARWRSARRRGAMTFALPGVEGSYFTATSTQDPFIHQELHRDSLSHALGDRARLLRTPRVGPRRRRSRISLPVSREGTNRKRSMSSRRSPPPSR